MLSENPNYSGKYNSLGLLKQLWINIEIAFKSFAFFIRHP